MYKEISENILKVSSSKREIYEKSKTSFLVSTIFAGFFVGIGLISMAVSVDVFGGLGFGLVKFTNGFIFTLALSLIVMIGGDLFTGNILIFTTASLNKKLRLIETIKLCFISYTGNFLGAIILSFLYYKTGLKDTSTAQVIVKIATDKVSYDFTSILFKGILCNILVCLAIVSCLRMKSESAKLIMIFWCIMAFVILGFEHSIANMTCFILAKILSKEITYAMIFKNLIPATIGNIIGGLIVSFGYYRISSK